jgi:peptide/nickel transport system substrate-binding protein
MRSARRAARRHRIPCRPGLTVFYLAFDVRPRPGNPFHDLQVRRALHLALDREQLVQQAYKGMAAVASQPVAPLVFGFNPQLPAPRRDTQAARRLLAEAGYARGFGTRLDISSARLNLARLIRSQWHEVGVNLALNGLPAEEVDRVAAAGQSPIYFLLIAARANPAKPTVLPTPPASATARQLRRLLDPASTRSPRTNAAILEPMQRRRALEQAAALVMADVPILPLVVSEAIYAVRGPLSVLGRQPGPADRHQLQWAPGRSGVRQQRVHLVADAAVGLAA